MLLRSERMLKSRSESVKRSTKKMYRRLYVSEWPSVRVVMS